MGDWARTGDQPLLFLCWATRAFFLLKAPTSLYTLYTTNSVEVYMEEEAFSFDSLIADIGGVLGLFIGFNFLMVGDWIVFCMQKILQNIF